MITKNSGNIETTKGGGMREVKTGKLRYDLLPPHALKRIAGLYTRGAEIYGDRNWEQGLPLSSLKAAAWRHFMQWNMGETDEDHLAAVCWNLMAVMHFEELGRKDLMDL